LSTATDSCISFLGCGGVGGGGGGGVGGDGAIILALLYAHLKT